MFFSRFFNFYSMAYIFMTERSSTIIGLQLCRTLMNFYRCMYAQAFLLMNVVFVMTMNIILSWTCPTEFAPVLLMIKKNLFMFLYIGLHMHLCACVSVSACICRHIWNTTRACVNFLTVIASKHTTYTCHINTHVQSYLMV